MTRAVASPRVEVSSAGGAIGSDDPRARGRIAIALIVLVALLLRALPIEHGMPRNYVPDTHVVRAALGMAKDKDLVPPAGRYSEYPNLLPYLLLPAYAAQYAAGRTSGRWSGAQEYGTHVLEHPESAQRIARWLVVLFGALTPWVVFRAARAAGLRSGALVAAALVATGLLHTHFSVQERPWVPMVFFFALSAWPAALYVRDGRTRRLLASGLAAALAFACHQGGLGALAITGFAWLFAPRGWRGPDLVARARDGFAALFAFTLAALVVGHPYYLRYGGVADSEVIGGGEAIREQGGLAIGAMSIVFDVRWESVERLSKALLGYDPVVLILGVLGLGLALRERATRPIALFTLAWAAFFLTNQSDHVRYLLPVTVLLAFPAGLFAERVLTRRPAGAAVLAILVTGALVQAVRFDVVMRREDTRAEAEARLAVLAPGARIAIDRYGPDVDLDRESLARLERLRASSGDVLRARERHRKDLLDAGHVPSAGPGIDAVRIEELFDVDTRHGTLAVRPALVGELGDDPREALRALGVTHVLLVDRRPRRADEDLLWPLVGAGSPVFAIDPSSSADPASEAFLPTEMDFPLTGLWSVERPGPLLVLHALR